MTWRVFLAQTTTGLIGREADPVSGKWSIDLNKIESGSLVVRKSDLAGVDRRWVTPWWASVVFAYVNPDGETVPWCGGPITGWSQETDTDLTLEWRGIREVLARRVLENDYHFQNMSYGTIAWNVVQAGMLKPGGALPIVHGSPSEEWAGGYERTYEAWNLANNGIDKRLTELSDVINGPDIMFRPQWARGDRSAVEWSMVHGTRFEPSIAQEHVPDWDLTAASSSVASASVQSEASGITTRVWGTGAGEGKATVITKAESLELVSEYYPFLESVISDTDQAKVGPILAKCRAALTGSRLAIDQLAISVDASDVKTPLGSWQVGDDATVTVGDEFWSIPSGTRTMRILGASGDLSETVSVDLQEGQWASPQDLI